jgi:transcription elongation GreA/GreB family factor
MDHLKNSLKDQCISVIQLRIDLLLDSIASAQAAANEETKSSAGDKYETVRAMNQLEKEMLSRQMAENQRELAAIMAIDCTGTHSVAKPGSLVRCADKTFFILGGLGSIKLGDEMFMVISPNAPLARTFMGKAKGDMVTFIEKEIEILEIL